MNKGFRLLGTGAAIWSRRTLQCTQVFAAPLDAAIQTQLHLFKVRQLLLA